MFHGFTAISQELGRAPTFWRSHRRVLGCWSDRQNLRWTSAGLHLGLCGLLVMFTGFEVHLTIRVLVITKKLGEHYSYTPTYIYLGGHLVETCLHMPQMLQISTNSLLNFRFLLGLDLLWLQLRRSVYLPGGFANSNLTLISALLSGTTLLKNTYWEKLKMPVSSL